MFLTKSFLFFLFGIVVCFLHAWNWKGEKKVKWWIFIHKSERQTQMRAKYFPTAGRDWISGSEITAGSLRGRAFEALTITSTDQSAISCIKLKGGVHVWTPGGPLTMRNRKRTCTHTCTHTHTLHLSDEWTSAVKKVFYKLMSCVNLPTASLRAQIKLIILIPTKANIILLV